MTQYLKETFMPEFNLLRPRQMGNERMLTTHGELDEEAVETTVFGEKFVHIRLTSECFQVQPVTC
jgi:hypothetical protein